MVRSGLGVRALGAGSGGRGRPSRSGGSRTAGRSVPVWSAFLEGCRRWRLLPSLLVAGRVDAECAEQVRGGFGGCLEVGVRSDAAGGDLSDD